MVLIPIHITQPIPNIFNITDTHHIIHVVLITEIGSLFCPEKNDTMYIAIQEITKDNAKTTKIIRNKLYNKRK